MGQSKINEHNIVPAGFETKHNWSNSITHYRSTKGKQYRVRCPPYSYWFT